MFFPVRIMMGPTPRMQNACELLINSMTQTEFIDLAEEAMLNLHEADDLFRSILTIKQADDAVTKTTPTEAKP